MGVAVCHRQNIVATRDWIRRYRIKILHVTGPVSFSRARGFLRAVLKNEAGV